MVPTKTLSFPAITCKRLLLICVSCLVGGVLVGGFLTAGAGDAAAAQEDEAGTITDAGALRSGAILGRSGDATFGETMITGLAAEATSARARAVFDGEVLLETTAAVDADGQFMLPVRVPAAQRSHTVEIDALIADEWQRVHTETDVAGGDIVILQGQSNAVANRYGNGPGLDDLANRWVKSFDEGAGWVEAVASAAGPGRIGQLGMQIGADLAAENGVPVAVINEAEGGRPIGYFQRNDAAPNQLSTNYGRLLTRLEAADLASGPLTFVWYQGESDFGSPAVHEAGVNELLDDWATDFPNIAHTYLVQIHNGCLSRSAIGDLPERAVQRDIAVARDDVSIVSTAALPGHDGCHYTPAGYAQLGSQIADLIQRDVNDKPMPSGIDSPTALSAQFASAERTSAVLVLANPTDTPQINGSTEFSVRSSSRSISDITSAPGKITLEFDGPLEPEATLRYLGVVAPWVVSSTGSGMVAFDELAISDAVDGDANCDGEQTAADAQAILDYLVGNRSAAASCPLEDGEAQIFALGADTDQSGSINLLDALIVVQCTSGIDNAYCQ